MIGRGGGVGGLAVGGVDCLTGVHHISHVAAVGISHLVVDRLQAAIGQNHGVGAPGGIPIAILAGVDLDSVVVVDGVVVCVDRGRVVGGLLVGSRGVGWGRGVAVAGGVVSGSQGSKGQNNEDLEN